MLDVDKKWLNFINLVLYFLSDNIVQIQEGNKLSEQFLIFKKFSHRFVVVFLVYQVWTDGRIRWNPQGADVEGKQNLSHVQCGENRPYNSVLVRVAIRLWNKE